MTTTRTATLLPSATYQFAKYLFANPNFVVAMVIMVVMGVVMFATMALLPPMLQHLFGYSVMDTGEAMMPRGVGTLLTMQLAGVLVRRGFDPRIDYDAGQIEAMRQALADHPAVLLWSHRSYLDGLIFLNQDLFKDSSDRRRYFGVDLVRRDFE